LRALFFSSRANFYQNVVKKVILYFFVLIKLIPVLQAKRWQQPDLPEDLIEWTSELYNEFKVNQSIIIDYNSTQNRLSGAMQLF
jgi:hypothetical protein